MEFRSYRDHGANYSILYADGKFSVFNKDGNLLLWECNISPFVCHPLLYKDAFIIPRHTYLWGTSLSWKNTYIDITAKNITHMYNIEDTLIVLDANGKKYIFPLSPQ